MLIICRTGRWTRVSGWCLIGGLVALSVFLNIGEPLMNTLRIHWLYRIGLLCWLVAAGAPAQPASAPSPAGGAIPHLERRGHATQLIVEGQPWLVLGAELRGTASSSPVNMEPIWPELVQLHLNTVLLALGWDWIEPQEGRFDFSLVDALIAGARARHLHIVFLWFGTWKNGISSFAPEWVKRDLQRFPRVRLASGRAVEIISPFSRNALDADTRAYSELMKHLQAADREHTVLMMQIENEVGLNGDTRDHGAAASEALEQAVPAPLMQYLVQHRDQLSPDLAALWRAAGGRASGTWAEVFGTGPASDDLFMAWHYARYLEHISAAGKAVYPLPTFTNTALAPPWFTRSRVWNAGAPQYFLLDVWKAGAPSIDFNAPDVYLPAFDEIVGQFHRPDNALFVPESVGDVHGVANAFYAIGAHDALGYSPFGIDDTAWLVNFRPDKGIAGTDDFAHTALAQGYAVLGNLAPAILAHQAAGTIGAAWLSTAHPSQSIALGDYTITCELRRSTRDQGLLAELGYVLVMATGADEYIVAGSDVQLTFRPRTPGPAVAGIADAELGSFVDGQWIATRKVNGDDILLNYDLAGQSQIDQSGSGLRLLPGAPQIQRVRLYRYQ
jgi:hypothetical protein